MSDLAIVAPARSDPYLDPASREFGFRARRFRRVAAMIEATVNARGQCDILDLGGTETYWLIGRDLLAAHRGRIRVTLVNPEAEPARDPATFVSLDGDATAPDLLAAKRFDIVHSNSVIEHVGSDRAMQAFADNVRRLGRNYYVQTPNFWFPYEPHFRIPGFQYLPATVRREMLRRFRLGFFNPVPDRAEAQAVIDHHRLVTTAQMRAFFPDAAISHEMLFGLKKSILAIRDHGPAESGRRSVAPPPLAADIDDLVGERPPTLVPGE